MKHAALLALMVVAGVFLNQKFSTMSAVSRGEIGAIPSEGSAESRAVPVPASAESRAVPVPASAELVPETQTSKCITEADVLSVGQRVDSLDQFGVKYRGLRETKLLSILKQSRELTQSRRLIEKSNEGALTSEELRVLITELRRQGILGQELARLRLKRLQEKYL